MTSPFFPNIDESFDPEREWSAHRYEGKKVKMTKDMHDNVVGREDLYTLARKNIVFSQKKGEITVFHMQIKKFTMKQLLAMPEAKIEGYGLLGNETLDSVIKMAIKYKSYPVFEKFLLFTKYGTFPITEDDIVGNEGFDLPHEALIVVPRDSDEDLRENISFHIDMYMDGNYEAFIVGNKIIIGSSNEKKEYTLNSFILFLNDGKELLVSEEVLYGLVDHFNDRSLLQAVVKRTVKKEYIDYLVDFLEGREKKDINKVLPKLMTAYLLTKYQNYARFPKNVFEKLMEMADFNINEALSGLKPYMKGGKGKGKKEPNYLDTYYAVKFVIEIPRFTKHKSMSFWTNGAKSLFAQRLLK